jgi:hypothetical protein
LNGFKAAILVHCVNVDDQLLGILIGPNGNGDEVETFHVTQRTRLRAKPILLELEQKTGIFLGFGIQNADGMVRECVRNCWQ